MARSQLVDDGLWKLVKPLLSDRTPQRTERPRVIDRAAFTAIVFPQLVLRRKTHSLRLRPRWRQLGDIRHGLGRYAPAAPD